MIKKTLKIFGFLLIPIVLLLPFFIKVKIECKSQFGQCPAEIDSKLQKLNGKFLIMARIQTSKILKSEFSVSEFSTQLKLPNIYLINLLVKKPVFSILSKETGRYFLIDKSGLALGESDNTKLPVVIKDSVLIKAGDTVTGNDILASKILLGLQVMYQIKTGTIQNDTLVVDMPSGIRVIFPIDNTDVDLILGSLRLIYAKVTADYPGTYNVIDMRYKNPVLK